MARRNKGMWAAILLASVVSLVIFGATNLFMKMGNARAFSGHLKLAADSAAVETARSELDLAIKGIEAKGYTSGYTSIFYNTPGDDIGFWYNNIKSADKLLKELPPTASQLEQNTVLLKLRQVLLDHTGKDGEKVTLPPGLHKYPFNWLFALWGWLSALVLVVSGLALQD